MRIASGRSCSESVETRRGSRLAILCALSAAGEDWIAPGTRPGSRAPCRCLPSSRPAYRTGLSRVYGPGLDTSFGLSPELIGGMRIKVGSDVYDASVRARLAALEAHL